MSHQQVNPFVVPEGDVLTEEQVLECLKLDKPRQLRDLIHQGLFPEGFSVTPKGKKLWYPLDVACFLWMRTRCRHHHAGKDDPPEAGTFG